MKKFLKKGFTIVELVIVIAVIAILTAVLIPTISSVVTKAQISADTQLVRNLNTALTSHYATGEKPATMHEAVTAVAEDGYDLTKIKESAKDNSILWDSENNVFCYLKDGKIEYIPNSITGTALKANDYRLWIISDKVNDYYSTYYVGSDKQFTGNNVITKGFDVGNIDDIIEIEYKNAGAHQDVVIRSNGGEVIVQAPNDVVKHYGVAGEVEIKEVASSSYHLYGEVTVKLTVEDGRAVVENGGKVAMLEVAKGAEEVVAEAGSVVSNLSIASDADINSEKLEVKAGAEVKVVVNNSATVETTALADAGVNVVETQSDAVQGKTMYNITKNKYYTGSSMSDSGDYILLKDLTMQLSQTIFASPCTLDLNGHSITNSTSGRPVVSAQRSGSYLEIRGNGELIQTRTESNSAVVLVSNENVKIGEGVKMSGGAVGVWCEGTSRAYTVEIAGQYTTTIEDSFGIYRNGTNKDTEKCPTVTIKKTAKFDVPDGAAVYAAGYAIWNIEGGEFKSNECFEIKAGILTIDGGKFEATASSATHNPNGNGTSANGYALAMVWNDGYAKPLTVTINGGEFIGPVAKLNDEEDPAKINSIVFNNNIGITVL